MSLDLNTIVQYPLPDDQYFKEEIKKTQIYIHHTAGGANAINVIEGWKKDSVRIGTALVVAGKPSKTSKYKEGEIYQAFPSKYWAYHLGLKKDVFEKRGIVYTALDKVSVGIEICNWGQVTLTDKGWETYVGSTIPESEVVEYSTPFRGYRHYHKYTNAQLESTKNLLQFLCDKLNIPKTFAKEKFFDINEDALKGVSGIYTHINVRTDKNDCHPQPELIQMLESL